MEYCIVWYWYTLDLCLDIVDRVAGLDFEGDGFARKAERSYQYLMPESLIDTTHVLTKICTRDRAA